MWGQFVLAFLVAGALLFVPGTVLARAARFSPLQCLGFGPVLSVAGYAVFCLAYERLGLHTNIATLGGGTLLVAVVMFAVARAAYRRRPVRTAGNAPFAGRSEWIPVVVAYCVVPLAACVVVFLKPMNGADSFMQAFDNIWHMGAIRGALGSGLLDPLGGMDYYSATEAALSPFDYGSFFYPEMWHVITVMVASVSGQSVPVAINAVNVAFSFVAMPFGVAALLIELFGADKRKVLLGSLGCVALESFPWGMLIYGPLYPNVSAFALVPATIALFLILLRNGPTGAGRRAVAAVFFVAGLLGCALVQPNAVFTVGVLVAPFCVWKASRLPFLLAWAKRRLVVWRILFGVAAVILICLAWVIMHNSSALSLVVSINWPIISSKKGTLLDIAFLGLMRNPLQIVAVVLIYAGIVQTIRHRKWLWLSFSYLLCCVLYFFCAGTDGFWDSFLTGFWYGDQYRIAGMVGLAGVPLFVLGLDWFLGVVARFVNRRCSSPIVQKWAIPAVSALVAMIIFFFPTVTVKKHDITGAFSYFSQRVEYLYNPLTFKHLSYEELQFAIEAEAIVGDAGLMANEPFDGSVYLFGGYDMPVYYKSVRGYGASDEKPSSALIRERLNEIAENEEVQQAVRDAGIRYVLQLDKGNVEKQPGRHNGYKEEQWEGIASINDDTPGFSVVLSRGDMRLYEIDSSYVAEI